MGIFGILLLEEESGKVSLHLHKTRHSTPSAPPTTLARVSGILRLPQMPTLGRESLVPPRLCLLSQNNPKLVAPTKKNMIQDAQYQHDQANKLYEAGC